MKNFLGSGQIIDLLEIANLSTRGKASQESITVMGRNNTGLETGQNFQSYWKFTLTQEDTSYDY